MNRHRDRMPNGYLALISAIVISMILLVIAFALSTSGFFARFNVLNTESKRLSLGFAEACASKAMLSLAQTASYAGGECLNINTGTTSASCPAGVKEVCKICSVVPIAPAPGTPQTVKTRAVYNSAYTDLSVSLSRSAVGAITVNSWDEQATYSGVPCPIP